MLTIKAALTGVFAFTAATAAALAEPKTNLLNQWSEGSDAAAIAKLGEMFTAAGGKWEQTSIAGHTANTLAKLRADVVAGNAPPAVQLKGPEITEWNETGKTANLVREHSGIRIEEACAKPVNHQPRLRYRSRFHRGQLPDSPLTAHQYRRVRAIAVAHDAEQ